MRATLLSGSPVSDANANLGSTVMNSHISRVGSLLKSTKTQSSMAA